MRMKKRLRVWKNSSKSNSHRVLVKEVPHMETIITRDISNIDERKIC